MPALTLIKRSLAVATSVATAVLGGAMLMTATSASYATPQGNNGTVKIGDQDINDIPNNNPHQGCEFLVEWYGFDADATSTVNFELQAPTAGAGYSLTATPAVPDTREPRGRRARAARATTSTARRSTSSTSPASPSRSRATT